MFYLRAIEKAVDRFKFRGSQYRAAAELGDGHILTKRQSHHSLVGERTFCHFFFPAGIVSRIHSTRRWGLLTRALSWDVNEGGAVRCGRFLCSEHVRFVPLLS